MATTEQRAPLRSKLFISSAVLALMASLPFPINIALVAMAFDSRQNRWAFDAAVPFVGIQLILGTCAAVLGVVQLARSFRRGSAIFPVIVATGVTDHE